MKKIRKLIVILIIFAIIGSVCYFKLPVVTGFINSITKTEEPSKDKDNPVLDDLQQQITALNENINGMMTVLSEKESQISLMTADLDLAYGEIDSQTRVINTLCGEIDTKNSTIANLENENTVLQNQITELERTQQELISNLQVQINNNLIQIQTLQTTIINLQNENISL